MRKIIILIFFIFFSIGNLFCIDWKTELKKCFISDTSISLGSYEYGNIYTREKNTLKIKYNLEMTINKLGYEELKGTDEINAFLYQSKMDIFSDFSLRDDGFLYGRIANEPFSVTPVKEVPVIIGNEFSFAILGMTTSIENGSEDFKKWLYDSGQYERKEKTKLTYNTAYNNIIQNVYSSSHLVEISKGIEIDYSGISLDWYILRDWEWPQDEINPFCFPWVENITGPGIDEWVEFELNTPQTITYILNGFVDGNRMHLYKANSRMKEAEITGWSENGKEIKQNVYFEDFVYFKTIQFSEPVTKFRITIKEAYPGDKWQDTCISAVMFPVERK